MFSKWLQILHRRRQQETNAPRCTGDLCPASPPPEPPWRQEWCAPSGILTPRDLSSVLEACSRRSSQPYYALATDRHRPGVAVRIDLSRGLTQSAAACLKMVRACNVSPWVLFAPVAAGDMGYAREGNFILDPKAVSYLRDIARLYGCAWGLLADPSACIARVLNTPFTIWHTVKDALAAVGIELCGYGCSFHTNTSSLLDMIWVYRATKRLGNTNYAQLLAQFGFQGREWLFEEARDPFFMHPGDGIESVTFTVNVKKKIEFLRSFLLHTNMGMEVNLRISFDYIAYTDRTGWRLLSKDGQVSSVSTDTLLQTIAAAPVQARLGIIIDPVDVQWNKTELEAEPHHILRCHKLRYLPYPFAYYLSVSSDVDWSTHDQIENMAAFVCDELGLAMAGSAYTMSRDAQWPAWSDVASLQESVHPHTKSYLGRWASMNIVDTLHGLTNSFDTVYFAQNVRVNDPPLVVDVLQDIYLDQYDGLLIQHSCDCRKDHHMIVVKLQDDSTYVYKNYEKFSHDSSPYTFYLYKFDDNDLSKKCPIKSLEINFKSSCHYIIKLQTAYATRSTVEKLLESIDDCNLRAPVFTGHGGGEGTWRFGVCVSRQWAEAHPEDGEMALDRPGTPYYILPSLKAFGVYFYNPNDLLCLDKLFKIQDMLTQAKAQDETSLYFFSRFYSTRYAETDQAPLWSYGKHGATAQGFPTNIEDVIQRMHWIEPGYGCILYTHLGHKIGNQASTRLGWNEEMYTAWSRLAEFVHARDSGNPVPFRIWFAPTSSILTFAAVMRHLPAHIKQEGHDIYITSWFDEATGHYVPDFKTFGTSWLHGITIYVPDTEQVKVFVDGTPITHFTCNPPDVSGETSITLVDSSWKRDLVPDTLMHVDTIKNHDMHISLDDPTGPTSLHLIPRGIQTEWSLSVPSVILRNVTHWTFEVLIKDTHVDWSVGFQIHDGLWFDAGTLPDVCWPLTFRKVGAWQRYTLAFADAAGSHCPHGDIRAIRIRLSDHRRADQILVRDVSIIRPCPTQKIRRNRRILAGNVARCVDNSPVSHLDITCQTPAGELVVKTNDAGMFIIRDLPDNIRCKIQIKDKKYKSFFMRGETAHMTCDQWDWDVKVF